MLMYFGIMLAIVLVDQGSKLWILHALPSEGDSLGIWDGVFRFTHVHNTGVAFGWLKDARWLFMIVSSLAIVGLVVYLFFFHRQNRGVSVAMSMIIGGGAANMIDRIFRGYVVDFLDFCAFPKWWTYVFNVADAFVVIGTFLLLIVLVREEILHHKSREKSQ